MPDKASVDRRSSDFIRFSDYDCVKLSDVLSVARHGNGHVGVPPVNGMPIISTA
jgi:hypothetical protein